MGVEPLPYEPTDRARPVVVETDAGVTRVFVAMDGIYAPIPRWCYDLELLSLIVVPLLKSISWLLRRCLRPRKPPRAVFEVTQEILRISFRERSTGELTSFEVPRLAIAEVRANRYSNGLWLDVPGHVKDTYLADLPSQAIVRVAEALQIVLGKR